MSNYILIVEDDPLIRRELKILLETALYEVTVSQTFSHIPDQVFMEKPDLVLLDVNLPEMSGFDICTQIRSETDIPVIFLTGRCSSADELAGMLKGADDYITKPFEPAILLARIAAVLKRTAKSSEPRDVFCLSHKNVTLDTAVCRLFFKEQAADLTKTELKILHLLFLQAGSFVAREDLLEYLWDDHIFLDDNTLSVHITRL